MKGELSTERAASSNSVQNLVISGGKGEMQCCLAMYFSHPVMRVRRSGQSNADARIEKE